MHALHRSPATTDGQPAGEEAATSFDETRCRTRRNNEISEYPVRDIISKIGHGVHENRDHQAYPQYRANWQGRQMDHGYPCRKKTIQLR